MIKIILSLLLFVTFLTGSFETSAKVLWKNNFPSEIERSLPLHAEEGPFRSLSLYSFPHPKLVDFVINKDHSLDLTFYKRNKKGKKIILKTYHYLPSEVMCMHFEKEDNQRDASYSYSFLAKHKDDDSIVGSTKVRIKFFYKEEVKKGHFFAEITEGASFKFNEYLGVFLRLKKEKTDK